MESGNSARVALKCPIGGNWSMAWHVFDDCLRDHRVQSWHLRPPKWFAWGLWDPIPVVGCVFIPAGMVCVLAYSQVGCGKAGEEDDLPEL
jgi:hypothetical protein